MYHYYIKIMYDFEFDNNKSISNKIKHGIDFEESKRLWNDEKRIIIPAKVIGESRYLMIAKMDNKNWSTVFTIRNDKIRIISVRRSRQNEIKLYENKRF